MLVISSSSTCDVCLEAYGPTDSDRAAHLIPCGHIFCGQCITHLLEPQLPPPHVAQPGACPLCRHHFFPEETRKLIIDVSEGAGAPTGTSPPRAASLPPTSAPVSRHIISSMLQIVNEGSSEENVRSVLDQCKSFFQEHDRSTFPEVHVANRLLRYLTDVRVKSRGQSSEINRLSKSLNEAETLRGELEKQVQDVTFEKETEKAVALATESSFREHLERLQEQYGLISNKYAQVVEEWSKLYELVQAMRSQPHATVAQFLREASFYEFVSEDLSIPQAESGSVLTNNIPVLKSATQTPSYFISPLPQFTAVLPSIPQSLPPIEEVEDVEVPRNLPRRHSSTRVSDQPRTTSRPSGSPSSHSRSSSSNSSPSSDSYDLHRSMLVPPPRSSPDFTLSPPNLSTPPPSRPPGGLSLTAPRSSESRDYAPPPIPPSSRSVPTYSYPSPNLVTPSRPVDPEISTGPRYHDVGYADGRPVRAATTDPTTSAHRDGNHQGPPISRLHDILNDPTQPSSLPNMTGAHFHNTAGSNSGSGSSSQSSQSQKIYATRDTRPQSPHSMAPKAQPAPPSVSTVSTTTTVVSRASDAANAHEKARRERERERERLRMEEAVASGAVPIEPSHHSHDRHRSPSSLSSGPQYGPSRSPPRSDLHRSSSRRDSDRSGSYHASTYPNTSSSQTRAPAYPTTSSTNSSGGSYRRNGTPSSNSSGHSSNGSGAAPLPPRDNYSQGYAHRSNRINGHHIANVPSLTA